MKDKIQSQLAEAPKSVSELKDRVDFFVAVGCEARMNSQSQAAMEAVKAADAWVDQGELLDMAYVRKHDLSRFQVGQMVKRRYPELSNHSHSPVLEKSWKGVRVVIVEQRVFCSYRWSNHHKLVRSYFVKNAQGRWAEFFKLSEIPIA